MCAKVHPCIVNDIFKELMNIEKKKISYCALLFSAAI